MADISFSGNVGNNELRFTPQGKAVLSLSVAENHRKKQGNEWVDDGTTWWRVTVWDRQAETLAEHAPKGTRVLVTGTVRSREFEHNGDKRTAYDVTARHVAIIPKADSSSSNGYRNTGGNQHGHPNGGQAGDPWATGGSDRNFTDEPPF